MPDQKRDYRILIVEDDPLIAKTYQVLLDTTFLIEVVHNVADGFLRLLDKNAPQIHAILLDLILPNGQGRDVVIRFRRGFPQIPIVVLTGATDINPEDIILAGAHDFLHKPSDGSEVREKLIYAIARHQSWELFKPMQKQMESIKGDLERHEARLNVAQATKDA